MKGCLYAHPLYKGNCDKFTFSEVPRRQRSMRGGRTEKKPAVQDAVKQKGSIAKARRKSQAVRVGNKAKPGTSDSEVICTHSNGNARLSRRLRGSTTKDRDMGKLGSGKFEIHLENIWRKLSVEKKNEFTYLDSLWFSLYAKELHKAKVLNWIKKKDIFSKKYVFVPIVQWGHWFLLIFCHFGESSEAKSKRPCMLLLDSMQKANSKQLEPVIRRFVFDIFKTVERPESKELIRKLPLLTPKVPQQTKGEECGFFVLYYISLFLESAPDNSSFSKGFPHFMKEDWFTPEDVECFVKLLDSMTVSSDCLD